MKILTNLIFWHVALALVSCERNSDRQSDYAEIKSNLPIHPIDNRSEEQKRTDWNRMKLEHEEAMNKVVIGSCDIIFDDELKPYNKMSIKNSTNRTIKGLEVSSPTKSGRINIKVKLMPHSVIIFKSSEVECGSIITGAFYRNGEYENFDNGLGGAIFMPYDGK